MVFVSLPPLPLPPGGVTSFACLCHVCLCSKTGGRNGGRFTLGRSTAVLRERAAGAFRRFSKNARLWVVCCENSGESRANMESGELESGEKMDGKAMDTKRQSCASDDGRGREGTATVDSSPRSLAMPFLYISSCFLYVWYSGTKPYL